jgi:hypothetical protein
LTSATPAHLHTIMRTRLITDGFPSTSTERMISAVQAALRSPFIKDLSAAIPSPATLLETVNQ